MYTYVTRFLPWNNSEQKTITISNSEHETITISNSTVSFPEELVHEILLILPPKSLVRFRKVCRSWNSLIKSPAFIRKHRSSRTGNHGAPLLLVQTCTEPVSHVFRKHYALHWDNAAFGEYTKLSIPSEVLLAGLHWNLILDNETASVAGTCNGLVCIEIKGYKILIWNPCIRKFVILPEPPPIVASDSNSSSTSRYAFGYDSRNNDYKVLRTTVVNMPEDEEPPCVFQIWSLAKGRWQSFSDIHEDFGHDLLPSPSLFANGSLHWVQMRKNDDLFILSFDMASHLFGEMEICEDLRKKVSANYAILRYHESLREHEICEDLRKKMSAKYTILRYHESLALCEHDWSEERGGRLNMWVMKEYGVAESWVKLFGLSLKEFVHCPDWYPLWFRKSTGEVVVHASKREVKSVDVMTEEVNDFRADGCDSYIFMDSFVESLELLSQPNCISY